MYAEVVVLTYQAPDIGSFTYEIPKNLEGQIKIGQLVQVPFGKRNPQAIVLDTRSDLAVRTRSDLNVEKIKSINSIVIDQPILLPYQIELLKWMASYYFAPMVNCVEAALPPLNAQRLTTNAKISNQKPVVRDQTLVLVPTITKIPEIMPLFKDAKNYIFYHNQLKSLERFANWLKILNGRADFVFGSRSAIFCPCPNLKKIIILDEHDGAYKDERSPYFDTLTIAEKLQTLTKAQLEIVDSSPKITTYFAHRNEISRSRVKGQGSRVKIVSMAEERQTGNKSPISSVLLDQLRKIRKIQGRSLLFLNKKAESGQIYCRACKQQNFAPKMPTNCPNCQSPDIFFHSLNINSLAQEVKKIVPQSSVRLISDKSVTSYQLPVTSYQIDISTSAIFYAPIFQKYDLVAHVSADSVLNIADIVTGEKFYSQISDLKKLAKENGTVILQTYNPENELLKNATLGNYRNFYENELKMRKMLLYPPYSLLVKLTIKGKKQNLILEKANNLISALQSIRTEYITILGPYEPVFLGKIPRYNIILKVKLNSYNIEAKEKAVTLLLPYISKVPKGFTITVEPDSLN